MGLYNFSKIKGLTAKDRQEWEKQNIDVLQGDNYGYLNRSDADRELLFKNYFFKEKFGNRSDYKTYLEKSSEERDKMLQGVLEGVSSKPSKPGSVTKTLNNSLPNGQMFNNQTSVRIPTEISNTKSLNKPEVDDSRIESQSVNPKELVDNSFKPDYKTNEPLDKPQLYQQPSNGLQDYNGQTSENVTQKSLKNIKGVLESPEMKQVSKIAQNTTEKYKYLENTTNTDFDKIAQSSSYYKMYKDSDRLPLDHESKAQMLGAYEAQKKVFGEEEAKKNLNSNIYKIVDENQPFLDKAWKTVAGVGSNVYGDVIATEAMLIETPLQMLFNARPEAEDFSAVEKLGYYLANNKHMQYANDVLQTGAWSKDRIEKLKELGINQNEIMVDEETKNNPMEAFKKDPIAFLANPENMATAIQQYGFTVASSLMSFGAAGILEKATSKAALKTATSFARKQSIKTGLDIGEQAVKNLATINKTLNVINPIVVNGIVSSGEAAINSIDTYNSTFEKGSAMVEQSYSDLIEREYQKRMKDIKYDETGTVKFIDNNGFHTMSNEEHSQYIKNSIEQEYRGIHDDLMRKAAQSAGKAAGYDYGMNSIINGVTNTMFKSFIHAPSVRERMARTKIFNPFQSSGIKQGADGMFKVGAGEKVKAVWKGTKGIVGEGGEEGLQAASQNATQDVALMSLTDDINTRLYPENKQYVASTFADRTATGIGSFIKSFADPDVQYQMVMGAYSSALGGPGINTHRASGPKLQGESYFSYLNRRLPITWTNSMTSELSEAQQEIQDKQEQVDVLNRYFQDPINKAKFDGVAGSMGWMNKMEKAADNDDEFSYRNSLLGMRVNDAMMLNKIKGTQTHESIMTTLNNIINADFNSQTGQNIVVNMKEEPATKAFSENYTDEELFTQVQKNAKEQVELIEKVNNEKKELDKLIGDRASDDVKQSLIYGKIAIDDLKVREKAINEGFTKMNIENSVDDSNVNNTTKKIIVEHSNVLSAKKKIEQHEADIKESQDALKELKDKDKKAYQIYSTILSPQITQKKEIVKTLKEELSKVDSEEDVILSEKEIMKLDEKSRAKILDENNLSNYSDAQQAVITNLKNNALSQDKEFNTKIQDVAKINVNKERILNEYAQTIQDPSFLNRYEQIIKNRNEKATKKIKFDTINKITDYREFVSKMQEIYDDTSMSNTDINQGLKDNPFYNKFKGISKLMGHVTAKMSKSPDFSIQDENLVKDMIVELDQNNINPMSINDAINYLGQNDTFKDHVQLYKDAIGSYQLNEEENKKLIVETAYTPPIEDTTDSEIPNKEIVTTESEQTVEGNKEQKSPVIEAKNEAEVKSVAVNTDGMSSTQIQQEIDKITVEQKEKLAELEDWDNYNKQNPNSLPFPFDFNEQSYDNVESAKQAIEEYYGLTTDVLNERKDIKSTEESLSINPIQEEVKPEEKIEEVPEEKPKRGRKKVIKTEVPEDTTPRQQFRGAKEIINGIIDSYSDDLYDDPDVKEKAKAIINSLEEYETREELADEINTRAMTFMDRPQLYTILSRAATDFTNFEMVSRGQEDFRTMDINTIKSKSVDNANRKRRQVEIEYYDKWGIETYLRNNPLTRNESVIMFITHPDLTRDLKKARGNDIKGSSLVAVVEDKNGPIQIGKKNYQPIGIIAEDSTFKSSKAVEDLRELANNTENPAKPSLLKKGGKLIKMTGDIKASPPVTDKVNNHTIKETMINDLSLEERAIMNGTAPETETLKKQTIYEKARDALMMRMGIKAYKDKNDNPNKTIVIHSPNFKDGKSTTPFDMHIIPIHRTMTRDGRRTIHDVLQNGSDEEILNSNSRLKDFSTKVMEIFNSKPFTQEVINNEKGALVNLEQRIHTTLGKILNIGSYKYKLSKSDKTTPSGEPIFELLVQVEEATGMKSFKIANISNDGITIAKSVSLIKNLLMNSDKTFRKKGNTENNIAMWDVNYNNVGDVRNNKGYLRKVIDDNLLESTKESLSYTTHGVNIYEKFESKETNSDKTITTQKDNATGQAPINIPSVISDQVVNITGDIVDPDSGVIVSPAVQDIAEVEIPLATTEITTPEVEEKKETPKETNVARPKTRSSMFRTKGVSKSTTELGKDTIEKLKDQGYTESQIENMPDELKDHTKDCIG